MYIYFEKDPLYRHHGWHNFHVHSHLNKFLGIGVRHQSEAHATARNLRVVPKVWKCVSFLQGPPGQHRKLHRKIRVHKNWQVLLSLGNGLGFFSNFLGLFQVIIGKPCFMGKLHKSWWPPNVCCIVFCFGYDPNPNMTPLIALSTWRDLRFDGWNPVNSPCWYGIGYPLYFPGVLGFLPSTVDSESWKFLVGRACEFCAVSLGNLLALLVSRVLKVRCPMFLLFQDD